MPIPLSVLVYESGANGVPQVTGRADNLRGKIDAWEHAICDRYGFEAARCSWNATVEEALDWARPDQLMRACEVFNPSGGKVWEGFLSEIEVSIGRVKLCLSIKDMANRLVVRYAAPDGVAAASTVYTNAASIALYGTKDRLLNLSTSTSTGAGNRAQTALNQIAFPKSKQPSKGGSGDGGDVTVTLKFMGWYEVLGWILTSSTSTTTTSASTQLTSLLAIFAAINAYLGTDTTQIQAGLPSETEWIDPETPVREKIDTLLASGDVSHERLHWGIFEDRALVVRTWAGATETTIGYYESSRTGQITDAYGNHIDPWDLRPDAMVQVVDVLDTDAPEGAIDSATRKYVARVTCTISRSGVEYTLEPDDVDSFESLMTSPAGSGPAGTSERQAKIERITTNAARPRFPSSDNTDRYTGGIWAPAAGGTGVANVGTIDTGGGDISNTGGGNVDLGTGIGIGGTGSSGVSTSGGTPGALAKWLTSSSLTDAVAGVDYAAASHVHSGADITSGTVAAARLGASPTASKVLFGDNTWDVLVAGDLPAHTHAAADIVSGTMATARLGSGTASATTLLWGDSTWAALVAGDLPAHTHAAADIVSGTMATARLGSGTASASTLLWGDSTWAALVAGDLPSHTHAAADITSGTMATARLGSGTASASTLLWGDSTWAALVAADLPAHASRHNTGGADALTALAASIITTGTMATARLGSGTASASTLLWGDSTWAALVAGDLPSHTHAAADIVSGTMSTARLGSGTATGTTALFGDNVWRNAPYYSSTAVNGIAFWNSGTSLQGSGDFVYAGAGGEVTLTNGYYLNDNGVVAAMGAGAFVASEVGFGSTGSAPVFIHVSGIKVLSAGTGGNIGVANKLMVGSIATAPTHLLQLINDDAAKTTTTTWTTTSDARTKTILSQYRRGIAFLRSLPRIVNYEQNGKYGTLAGVRSMNFIAQEVQQVAPEWVVEDGNGVLKLNNHELQFALLNAVLELAGRMDRYDR